VTWTAANVLVRRSLELAVLLGRPEASKEIEILARRHERTVLCRDVPVPDTGVGHRLPLAALSRLWPRPGGGVRGGAADRPRRQLVTRPLDVSKPGDPQGRVPGGRSGLSFPSEVPPRSWGTVALSDRQ
jgi:hypothetical protein